VVLVAWLTFKKAEMAKILRNGLSMNKKTPSPTIGWIPGLDFLI
jgi:hypothetical protein